MFSPEDLQSLDRNYFSVIVADEYDVTIMSRNTGHFWYLHNPEYPEKGTKIYSTNTRLMISITCTVAVTAWGRW
nr:hypothetical protein [Mediterraneibacter glycyrrhizinilyticus]